MPPEDEAEGFFAFVPLSRHFPDALRIRQKLARQCLSEFLCTFLFLLIGIGTTVQIKAAKGVQGNFFTLNFCWGLAVLFSSLLGAGVSGGQTNPSVSLVQCALGRLSVQQAAAYCLVQVLGAFAGTATAYLDYLEALDEFDGGRRTAEGSNATLCFFVSCPAHYASHLAVLFDQIVGTAILCCTMAALLDPRNRIAPWLHPVFGGLTVMMIGLSFAQNDAYPIHAARDLGARLFVFIVYGNVVWRCASLRAMAGSAQRFSVSDYFWWVPVVGPLIGGFVGALVYVLFVDVHAWSSREETELRAFRRRQLHSAGSSPLSVRTAQSRC